MVFIMSVTNILLMTYGARSADGLVRIISIYACIYRSCCSCEHHLAYLYVWWFEHVAHFSMNFALASCSVCKSPIPMNSNGC